MSVRAKFRCLEVAKAFSYFETSKAPDGSLFTDPTKPVLSTRVRLVPVQNKGSEENRSFWEATPSGELTMQITNPYAAMQFQPGKVYYLDFSEAEE